MGALTLLISPHLDDAALSLGGILSGNVLQKPLLNVNIFTKSTHAPYGYRGISGFIPKQLRKGIRFRKMLLMREITRQRKREDLLFFKSQGIPYIDLDLLEAPLRGYTNIMKVSRPKVADHLTFESIRSFVLKIASNADRGYILLPLGLGNHIDHRIARDASLSGCGNLCPIFYEDLPYAADLSLDEIDKTAASFDTSLRPSTFEIQKYLQTKINNIKLYGSQIGHRQISRTVSHAERLGENKTACERLWFPSNRIKDAVLRFDQFDTVENVPH